MYALTGKQETVLAFIRQYFLEHHRSPLIREIQLACQIASYKSVLDRLNALEHKGYIKRLPNKHRGIRIVRRATEAKQDAGSLAARKTASAPPSIAERI